jgi:ubiquinone biosynthesis protein COQ4
VRERSLRGRRGDQSRCSLYACLTGITREATLEVMSRMSEEDANPPIGGPQGPMARILARLRLRWMQRTRPLVARRALQRLLQNPDDTEQVFHVIRALSGRSFERLLRRVRRDPVGREIVRERRNLIPVLSNRERLLSLPKDTLGHRYARFIEAEQISSQGLADVSIEGANERRDLWFDPEAEAFGARLRDMHDLWHVVTGYSRDVLGELALLAFTYEQTGNRGIGYIVRQVERRMRRGGNLEISDFLKNASERGRRAALLPAADWEALLERSLEEVRLSLRVGDPVEYEQRRTAAGEAAVAATA